MRRAVDVAARAGLDAAYLAIGLVTSVVAFTIWVVVLSVTLSLAVFIIGLPLIALCAFVFRWTAELDRRNAALALGIPLRGRYRDHGGDNLLARLFAPLRDPQTWRDLAWLVVHSLVGFAFGVAALTAIGVVVAGLTMPAWYWAIPDGGPDVGVWNIDTLPKAFAVMGASVVLAAATVGLLRLMAFGESRLAAALLGPRADDAPDAGAAEAVPAQLGRRATDARAALGFQAALSVLLGAACTLIWALTGASYFWPQWVWLGVAIPLALHGGIRWALETPSGPRRYLAIQGAISAVIAATMIVIWSFTGGGSFWPAFVILALAVAFGVHWVIAVLWRRVFPAAREQELVERVDELTRTRRGALDVQDAELRRIERDLHDGAQARLVSLSMRLGRAEERLSDQPEMAALVREARGEAGAAIAELRDLARGIAPPVLADRGLAAAVEALGRRAAIPVAVEVHLDGRPPAVIEAAAYFVVAEALTNVAKHAPDATASVVISLEGEMLVVEAADDGPGGADPDGGGLGGLRGRVEALDGTLTVVSPAGSGTTIRAELPCES